MSNAPRADEWRARAEKAEQRADRFSRALKWILLNAEDGEKHVRDAFGDVDNGWQGVLYEHEIGSGRRERTGGDGDS